jgi:nitrous oxidase accessory protein NosD
VKRTARLGIVVLLLSIFSSLSGVFPVSAKPFTYVSRIDPVLAATTCSLSLQSLVDAAAPGAVVSVPACMYRETVTINKPLTLDGRPGAEIRGSDVWSSGWKKRGRYWTRGTVPAFAQGNWPCMPWSHGQCRWPEQVFFDGRPLDQVAASPHSGQFAIDSTRRVILADDPRGHMVEVTTRQYWITGKSDNVTIQGFTMKHAATPAQHGALSNDGHDNWTIQNNTLSDAHGAVVSLIQGNGLKLLNSDISRGGQEGIHGWAATDVVVQGNRIHDNNTEAFDSGWGAAGLKMTVMTRLTIADNEVFGNDGPALWCDIDCSQVTIKDNRVHHNSRYGIGYEISRSATISGNRVWENGSGNAGWGWGAGILSQNSGDVDIHDNVVAWNADGISVISQNRNDSPPVVGNNVHDNKIFSATTGAFNEYALAWLQDWNGSLFDPSSNNRGANNAYWFEAVMSSPYAWRDDRFSSDQLVAFNATPGEENGRYLSAQEKGPVLSAAGVPVSPEHRK